MAHPSSSSLRLHGLDTLRAAAILAVVLYHLRLQGLLPPALSSSARVGWVGVDLFFVLSGFLIGSQLFRSAQHGNGLSLQDFYTRRAFRILPAFFVVLLLYGLVPLWREAPGPYAAWQYATFTWNLLLLGYPEHRAFSHVWSLCVEEHFYLVLPLLVRFLQPRASLRRTLLILAGVLLGGIALRAWLFHAVILPSGEAQGLNMMRTIYYPTYSRLDGLLVGVALALVRVFRPREWARLGHYRRLLPTSGAALLLFGLWLCAFDYPSPELPASLLFAFPILSCGFGLLVAAAAAPRGPLTRRVPGASALATLAFSLYLTHKSVAHAVHHLLPGATAQRGWAPLCLYALACLGVAATLYVCVERPCLALRPRFRPAAHAADAEARLDPAL